jgi:hypothetical protein
MIKHIVPADGWNAVYASLQSPYYRIKPVAVWVSQVDDMEYGEEPVIGLVAEEILLVPGAIEGFIRYAHDKELTEEYRKELSQRGWDKLYAKKEEVLDAAGNL